MVNKLIWQIYAKYVYLQNNWQLNKLFFVFLGQTKGKMEYLT